MFTAIQLLTISLIAKHKVNKIDIIKKFNWRLPNRYYIVTKDELPLPENVNIVTKVNDKIRQMVTLAK